MSNHGETTANRPKQARTPSRGDEDQLLQARRLEAMGWLAAGIAHDFNNLLQVMATVAHVLRRHAHDPERVAAAAGELERHIASGAQLAGQLLLFSRDEPAELRPEDLGHLVREAATYLRRVVREDVAFSLQLAAGALWVRAERWQLEQVLINLVANAADAMPDGGTLTLRTGGEVGGVAWLEVTDTGSGVPDDIAAHLFEPFYTTKAQGEGTGLGLAVVHQIVTRHGGTVSFSSEVGHGSTFRVALPWRDEESAEIPPVPARPPVDGHGLRVLLVEDDEAVRLTLDEVLTALGFTVRSVRSGEEAVAEEQRAPCDVLVADYLLPGISGLELAGLLRSQRPDLRVVLISGYAEEGALRRIVGEGGVSFLRKPCSVNDLAEAVGATLQPRAATESTAPVGRASAGRGA